MKTIGRSVGEMNVQYRKITSFRTQMHPGASIILPKGRQWLIQAVYIKPAAPWVEIDSADSWDRDRLSVSPKLGVLSLYVNCREEFTAPIDDLMTGTFRLSKAADDERVQRTQELLDFVSQVVKAKATLGDVTKRDMDVLRTSVDGCSWAANDYMASVSKPCVLEVPVQVPELVELKIERRAFDHCCLGDLSRFESKHVFPVTLVGVQSDAISGADLIRIRSRP